MQSHSLFLSALVAFALGCAAASEAAQCSAEAVPEDRRVDCFPMGVPTEQDCVKRGCCWNATTYDSSQLGMNTPYCFYPANFGYNLTQASSTPHGWKASLSRISPPSPYGGDIPNLSLEVIYVTDSTLRFRITDPSESRFEVPIPVSADPQNGAGRSASSLYEVTHTQSPFGLAISRKDTGTVVWNSTFGGMIYSDQFLQISSTLNSTNLYGLGEHVLDNFKLNMDWQANVLYAADQGTPTGQWHNLYGVHPFYLNMETDGNANGVFFLNSNAMDIVLQPTPGITYRTIGGILDFFVFLGPSPDEVVQQYHSVIGTTFLPPYWALGFHLCRWGYDNTTHLKEVNDRMRSYGIPQDVQWSDIDYMEKYHDFTYDKDNFDGFPQFVRDLHNQHQQHYVLITDPGIPDTLEPGTYAPYDEGQAMNVWINASDGQPWKGSVWPGQTVFPDFWHPNGTKYWHKQISDFHQQIPFSGLWIDMNEPSTVIITKCGQNKWNNPPYPATDLLVSTCPDALQYPTLHYNLHSLYGYSEMIATMDSLKEVRQERSLVISRSTFANSGVHGGHWLGDNTATWQDMRQSIPGVLSMSLFGLELVGPDICGFNSDTTEELCRRWMQLGAFYPFSRNHNTWNARPQDPGAFGDDFAAMAREMLLARYSILPFLYTEFARSHMFGGMVARPLLAEFPKDANTYDADTSFLLGSAILAVPVLDEGATTVQTYLPGDQGWFCFWEGKRVDSGAGMYTFDAPSTRIPVFLQGGSIVLTQEPNITTASSRQNPFGLTVVPQTSSNGQQEAEGDAILDDGVSLDSISSKKYTWVAFKMSGTQGSSGKITNSFKEQGYDPQGKENFTLDSLKVLDLKADSVDSIQVMLNQKPFQGSVSYNTTTQVLALSGLGIDMGSEWSVSWQTKGSFLRGK